MNTQTNEIINISKGQKVDLTKAHAALLIFVFGLGWDVKANAKTQEEDFDLDAFAVCLGADGKILHGNVAENLLFFNSNKPANDNTRWIDETRPYPFIHNGALSMPSGDNRTGAGDGDDETIHLDISKIPADCHAILIGANIFEAKNRKQNFGQVQNAFCRIFDPATPVTGSEFMRFDLSEDASMDTGFILGKVYRRDAEWKFEGIGTPVNGNVLEIANSYL